MKRLVLASASPRRRELLEEIAPFDAEPSRFAEESCGLAPRETAEYFAEEKAKEVFSRFPDCIVLGADTVVAAEGRILGKPKDKEDARTMLMLLSGKTHSVFTGVCILCAGYRRIFSVETRVTFHKLNGGLIESYIESGLPFGKAGAYGIQDGYPLVKEYEGSYTNVVGLPVDEVRATLEEINTDAETCD